MASSRLSSTKQRMRTSQDQMTDKPRAPYLAGDATAIPPTRQPQSHVEMRSRPSRTSGLHRRETARLVLDGASPSRPTFQLIAHFQQSRPSETRGSAPPLSTSSVPIPWQTPSFAGATGGGYRRGSFFPIRHDVLPHRGNHFVPIFWSPSILPAIRQPCAKSLLESREARWPPMPPCSHEAGSPPLSRPGL